MNKVLMMGRLTADPEVRQTAGDTPTTIARFSLAVDRRVKREGQEQTADFPSCVAFGKTAEFIEKYFTKGRKIAVEGRLQTGSYTNQNNVKVYTTDIVVEAVDFADGKPEGTTQAAAPQTTEEGFMNIPDGIEEELPFS